MFSFLSRFPISDALTLAVMFGIGFMVTAFGVPA